MEELLNDYQDFLRQARLPQWGKDHTKAKMVRDLAAANTIICLVHQTSYLLDQQLRQLEQQFLKEGGFGERLYNARKNRQ